MRQKKFLLSTMSPKAAEVAKANGLGLEIAEFCTAFNFDKYFEETNRQVCREIEGVELLTFHAAFNELFPCAIDLKVREIAGFRYRQAIEAAKGYGTGKVVIHSGYTPTLYYPIWFEEQSIEFWKEFIQDVPQDVTICVENVFEQEPEALLHILEQVNDPRFRMCMDIGHVSAYSEIPVTEWLEVFAPWIAHFHIHNNDGTVDSHQPLPEGKIPMKQVLTRAREICPGATYTMELMEPESSVEWLKAEGFLEEEK